MTETIITVQGRFQAAHPPERATLTLSVQWDGADRDAVYAATTASADEVRSRLQPVDAATGPLIRFSSDSVQLWTERPWNQDGRTLDPVFHARVGFIVVFAVGSPASPGPGTGALARFVDEVAGIAGVSVGGIDWALTDASRSAALAEVRSRAVKDAVAKASVYAQSIGLGTVRAIALADEGMLDGKGATPSGHGAELMRMSAGAASASPPLSLAPEEIRVEAVVDARFVAT
ncbi:MAG: SIMPL domain-containing protein [Burkholderiaceae bacterium]|nr:SIMPL domain-containing protein [Microbacteriaceae bacterium]